MEKLVNRAAIAFVFCLLAGIPSGRAASFPASGDTNLKQNVTDLKNRVSDSEEKIGSYENQTGRPLQAAFAGLRVGGGISAGSFYASSPGEDTSDNEFLLSNLLIEVSSKDAKSPVGFVAAFGETSTPSLLSTPENNTDFDIEYASVTVKPTTDMSLEVGLLQPNGGFENTYTFNNRNVILGVLASQQPYNAYGARLGYNVKGFHLCAGYYKKRLDKDEYNDNGAPPGDSWEIGVSGSVSGNDFSLYHYQLETHRNLTGLVIERTAGNIYLALNVDYWRWSSEMKPYYGDRSAIGAAFYVAPSFGAFSIPVRLEYVDQGESRIYTGNVEAKHIYAATVSPTYRFCDHAYIRAESAYVKAEKAFIDTDGNRRDHRICLAAEIGYLF